MPIPKRNPLAPPEPEPVDYQDIAVPVKVVDVMFVGGLPRSFTLEESDEIEWSNNVLLLVIKGAEISIYLHNVLSIDEYKSVIKKRVKLDPIGDLKKALPVGGIQ